MGFWEAGTFGAVVGGVVFFCLRTFFGSYLGEKGKNLATKEDVREITRLVEEVKNQFAEKLEDRKASHQLRVASLDKRLAAHQQAFALWRELGNSVYDDSIKQVVQTSQKWWEEHCLYLEPDVRQAFLEAYVAARKHKLLLDNHYVDAKGIQDNWDRIMRVGNMLLNAVALPPMSSAEKEDISVDAQGKRTTA